MAPVPDVVTVDREFWLNLTWYLASGAAFVVITMAGAFWAVLRLSMRGVAEQMDAHEEHVREQISDHEALVSSRLADQDRQRSEGFADFSIRIRSLTDAQELGRREVAALSERIAAAPTRRDLEVMEDRIKTNQTEGMSSISKQLELILRLVGVKG